MSLANSKKPQDKLPKRRGRPEPQIKPLGGEVNIGASFPRSRLGGFGGQVQPAAVCLDILRDRASKTKTAAHAGLDSMLSHVLTPLDGRKGDLFRLPFAAGRDKSRSR